MSRTQGIGALNFNIERQTAAPLDATEVVEYYSDLTSSVTWLSSDGNSYEYIGMKVFVVADPDETKRGMYWLKALPITSASNWEKVGTGGSNYRVEELPEPSEELEGQIYQYVGETTIVAPIYTKGYFYICVEDSENPGTYVWKQKNVQPSAEGGSTLERDITANVNVGGVTSGKTFLEGTSITDVLESILVQPIYQTVTLTLSEDLLQKIGTTISSIDMTANIVKGDSPITNAKYYVGASLVDTKDSTTDPGIINGGTYTYEYNTPFSTDTIFKVDVLAGEYVETVTQKIHFINPFYYGISDTSTVVDFTGLTEKLAEKSKQEFAFTADGQYLVFAYDSSYGNVASIIDQNGFDNTSSFTKSTLEVEGTTYNVYVSNDPTVCTNFKYTISF